MRGQAEDLTLVGPRPWSRTRPAGRGVAHPHPSYDGSLHLALPADLAADVSRKGWGRPHMWAGTRISPGFVMVYGPRDEDELATVQAVVAASHASASGIDPIVR